MQTPQDTVDPLFVDASLRNKVLIRHFARQSISSDDLAKLDKLVMADSREAVITRTAGMQIICLLNFIRLFYFGCPFLRREDFNRQRGNPTRSHRVVAKFGQRLPSRTSFHDRR